MFILVPIEKVGLSGLNKLEDKLTVEVLEDLFSRMESKTVSIQLPKFRIQQKLHLKVRVLESYSRSNYNADLHRVLFAAWE